MDSTLDDAEAAAAATTTPPRNETEDHDSTDVRAATRGDEIPSSTKPPRRDGSPSSVSTNSLGFVSPSADASGERSSKALSTPRLPSTGRASSDYEGSEVLSMRGSLTRSSRRLFRDNSIGPRSSSTRSVLSYGSTGSSINPKASVSAAVKAAADGDARSVVQFLNSGGDINAKCKTSASTPLSRAAAKGHLKIVKLLLDRGAGVNIPGRGGLTPLHEAAGCGKVEVCRLLLGGGAAVAANDHSKRTPLHYSGTSVEVTKLLLEFGADPNAQDKNGQRPDAMAISHEARGLLRDARCTVREDTVGNNASRVIASLRRELENLEREAQAAKEAASEEEVRRKEVQLEVDELRGHVSKLSQENDILRKEAAETGPIEHVSEAAEAELKQMRASLRVARAAASEEKRRRENLEDSFDSHVAEAVAKAIAVAASRLLDRMPDSDEEEEEEGAVKRAKRGEDVEGDGEEQTLKSFGGNAWGAEVGEMEPDHGDGDADLPEPVRAVPSAWGGKRKDGGKFGDGDDADGGDADGDDGGSDAEDKEEEQGGKGFVEQRTDELLEATAGLLPRSTTLLRQWYSVGATPPRQAAGSLAWVSTKGYEGEDSKPDTDCSGCSDGDAGEEGGRMLTVKTRSFENVLQGERGEGIESGQPFSVARSISARVPLETVGSDWTGTNEDNQDELGTVPGAAAPPSTTSENRVQGADMGKYIPASGDERDSDGSIHDEAVVEPSTFEPDGTATTLAAAEGAPRESSVSPGHEIGVSAEPIAARGDESPGDGAETAAGQFSVARSFSARVPLETVGSDWTGTNEDNQDELGTVPEAAAPPSTTSEDCVQGAYMGKYITASGDERDSDGSIHDEAVVEPSTFEPDGTAATLAAAEGAPRESSVSPGHEIGVSAEPIAARGDESPGDGAETAAGQFSVARSISARVPLETVGADWTGTNEDNQDELGTVPGAAAPPSTTSEDRVQGADMGKYISASGDEGDGDGSIHDEAVVEPSTFEPDGTAATLAAAEGAPRESSVSPGHEIGVSAEPIAARGDESPGDGAETAAGQFSVARSFSARVPLETVGSDWTGTNEDNQDELGTVPGAAAPPSTTSEDRMQGADMGKYIPASGDERDSDGSIHDEVVVEPSTFEPDGTAATLAAAEGAPRESSVSPGHEIGVSAEPIAARGDESPGDGAEMAAGQFSVARSISARVSLETVGADWTGTNEDNQDELGTVPGAAAPPSTTSEDRVQEADMGKYIPASGDERDGDGSIHDEAVVEPSTFEPDGTAATLAAAEGAPRESSVSPGHEIGVSAEPIAARGDESPGDGAETAAGQFSVARSISARVSLETVGADWTGTNEDNQDELGTVPGAAAPPSTTSEDRVQGADMGKYIPASGDERDGDGSIHDEAVVEPSTFEPDGTAATLAAAEGAPRESSVSPGHEIGVSAEPIAARGDESPGDGAEMAAGQFSVARSFSARVPLETVGADWTGTNEDNQDELGTVPGAAASPSTTSEDRVQGADVGKYIPASGDERDGDGSIHDEVVVEPSTFEPDGTAATLAAAEGAPRESSVSPGHEIGVSAEPIAARGDESPGDGAETAARQFSVARSISARIPLETVGADWTGTNEDNQDELGTVPGAAAPHSTSEDRVQGADMGKYIPASGDEGDGDGSIHDETVVEPSTFEPDGTAATLAAAEGAPRESSVSLGHGIGVSAEPIAARGDESPGDGAETAAGQFSVARSISARAPLETIGAGWTGTNEDNQDDRETVPGAAAPPSTTSEDRVQGADMGKCIPAPGDEGDSDGSIHDEAVVEPSTPEPDGTAATLAAVEGAPRESSVSPGHGIGVIAESNAARGDESPGDGAERAAGQKEGAATGGLGGDAVPLVLEDLAEEMVAAFGVENEEDDYYRYEGDDEDYYDDDDDDDDIDFFNYLSKYETESSKDVGQTTDARVWEGLAAALKVELEEKKARIFDLSIENRRLRREAADWAMQCAYQKEQNHHEQLERQQQQEQQQQRWWQQWWEQLWWGQGQHEDVEISLHERVGMRETEPEPEGGILVRMSRGIPRVAHPYWEH